MATPKKGYWIGKDRLPGVTTVLGRFKESGALIQAAFKVGKEMMPEDQRGLYDVWGKSATIGTAAHNGIEAFIAGDSVEEAITSYVNAPEFDLSDQDRDEMLAKATRSFGQFERWFDASNIELLSGYQEVQLVHPVLMYGGTPDAIGRINNGPPALIDWKTSNALYREYLIQCVAYIMLVNDGLLMETMQPLGLERCEDVHICRFAKDFDDFEHRSFSGDLGDVEEYWGHLLKAYALDKALAKRLK